MIESNFFNKRILPILFGGMSTTPCPLRIHLNIYNQRCKEHLSSLCKTLHHRHFQVWRDCFLLIRGVWQKEWNTLSIIMIKRLQLYYFPEMKIHKSEKKACDVFFWLFTLSLLVSLSYLHYHTQHTHLVVCTHVHTHVHTNVYRAQQPRPWYKEQAH